MTLEGFRAFRKDACTASTYHKSCMGEQHCMVLPKSSNGHCSPTGMKLCPDTGTCPVSFSQKDHDAFEQEVECREFVAGIRELFKASYRLPPEGTISPARYDELKSELARLRTVCYEEAENDDERMSVEKLWPYQDTKEIRDSNVNF